MNSRALLTITALPTFLPGPWHAPDGEVSVDPGAQDGT